ncbi:SusC/RagA family TonB-linked outer membrane protein [Allomuricauda sp. SCSIO 65647]|uniref:SusC/RagA family TonB-linked outer membrane protein n=1 Tax=Allomuricauda sp. SCSIO 65647 TaxID=2908843 RepID=UPI001F224420|nr:TonB-dependent receptor [Muricauda sp. SCSIO 65647]UJH67824.1 TonB-dependent receptor [Muricauda sp. SCSIO 65647]
MKDKTLGLTYLLMVFAYLVNAQTIGVRGVVVDKNDVPLPGASIVEKGTANGTTTDFDGNFEIRISGPEAVLTITYIGYTTEEIVVGNQTDLYVRLSQDASKLDEVVVVGYGTQRKSDVTTSVASLKAEAIQNETTTNFTEAIAGKLAGVLVRQTTGEPGGNLNIRVRGASSITAGNNPLFVVDGVPLSDETNTQTLIGGSRNGVLEQPTNPLASINQEDIESIEVLKDAAAAAIYGSRGSNGVVIITTKRGKSGDPSVSLTTRAGFSSVINKIDLLNAYEFAELHADAKNNAYLDLVPGASITDDNATRLANGQPQLRIPEELEPYLQGVEGLTDTDWQDEIFRNALNQNYTLTIQGGSSKASYFSSLNYNKQEGIVIGSEFERFSGRLNINGNLSEKIKYGIRLNPSRINQDLVNTAGFIFNEGVVASALAQAPIFPVRNPDDTFNIGILDWTFLSRNVSSEFVGNPVAIADQISDEQVTTRILGNGFLDFEFLPNLTYRITAGAESNESRRDFYRPLALEATPFFLRFSPDAVSVSTSSTNWLIENTLTYNNLFGKHSLNLLGGYTAQMESIKLTNSEGRGFANDLVPTISAASITASETFEEEWSLLSVLFRAQYAYDNKYFATVTVRSDGSSRFGSGNKWGTFPSASLGWRLSQENFLRENKTINELKLRASYGVTGNFQIPNYGSIGLLDQASYVTGNNNIVGGLSQTTSANNDLSWERTETFDIGLNASLFNNFVTLEADYYRSETSDLLLNVNVPSVSGFTNQLQNIGRVENKGFEFTLGLQKDFGDFEWQSSFNFSTNKNEVLELGPEGDPIFANGGRGLAFITEIGRPIGSYYGLKVEGIYNTEDEINQHLSTDSGTSRPGDFRFEDVNGDGRINDDDRQVIGDYQPDFTYGFSTSFKYKNVDLSIALQGVEGNEVLNTIRFYTAIPQGGINGVADLKNRWRSPEDPGNGRVPRANLRTTGNNREVSTYYLEDGSYLRIQNITLGYTVPKTLMDNLGLDHARIFLAAQNPFLFTDYTGYNPEVNSNPTNQLAQGEDIGTYPLSRTISLGLNLNF